VDVSVIAPLVEAVREARPDITVVSGDFVQNGTRAEFQEAREFVRQLPRPLLTVPGNHDMPFLNIFQRVRVGLDYYREYISEEAEPFYSDDEIAIMGVNTARLLKLRGGKINETQIKAVEERLCALDGGIFKVLVTHHPFDLDERYDHDELVGRARRAMGRFAQSIDLLLAGHMHMSQSGHTATRYRLKGRSAIFVQAGTATSTRGRGEPNAFNLIRLERPALIVERRQWDPEQQAFRCVCADRFEIQPEPAVCTTSSLPANEREVEVQYPVAA
jgi:3',5'-cyclic AMP phosphodiesterase CpdA